MKKTIMISIWLLLIFSSIVSAQENKHENSVNSIYCAEIDVVISKFEFVDASPIRICCGGPFTKGEIPCQMLNKASYESFSGQSDVPFISGDSSFCVVDLIENQKRKISKIKSIEITESSMVLLENNLRIAVKKGIYLVDNEGKVWLEVEYLK